MVCMNATEFPLEGRSLLNANRPRCDRCGFPDHELGLDRDLRGVFFPAFDSFKQTLRRDFAHAAQRLTDCGEAGTMKSGAGYVVETHHRNILRHAETLLLDSPNRTDR